MFEEEIWSAVPFHFWTVVYFALGCVVGSFLNVCIHRMPRSESIVHPPSHCPHCGYSIPWYLNIPLVTWLVLRGRCANCQASISFRYFVVEMLTGLLFTGVWLVHGTQDRPLGTGVLTLVYCVLLAGLIVATFIDLEHYIIPDEITLGGVVAGFIFSFAVPALHEADNRVDALQKSFWGIVAGAGIVYLLLRIGKMMFGRQRFKLGENGKAVFTESVLKLPDEEIPYEDLFYRKTDRIELHARQVELNDRCYWDVPLSLSPQQLVVGEDTYNPEEVSYMTVVTEEILIPREAMGLGDVKFMAGIGAFIGWHGVIFSLMVSAMIGALTGVTLVAAGKQEWSSRLPYGPFIALATVLWIYGGSDFYRWWLFGAL